MRKAQLPAKAPAGTLLTGTPSIASDAQPSTMCVLLTRPIAYSMGLTWNTFSACPCSATLIIPQCPSMPPCAGFGDEDVYLQGNIWEQYLLCYYWTVATLTTNGQIGEMGPKCMLEVGIPISSGTCTWQPEFIPAVMTPYSH